MSVSVLSRLLSSVPQMMGGRGGKPALTQSDVAMALGGQWEDSRGNMRKLSIPAEVVTRAKYAPDAKTHDDLLYIIAKLYLAHVRKNGWPTYRPRSQPELTHFETALRVAEVARIQYLCGFMCPSCHGRMYIDDKLCRACGGTGRGYMTDESKAAVMGMPRKTFAEYWRARLYPVYDDLATLEAEGIRHVVERLK